MLPDNQAAAQLTFTVSPTTFSTLRSNATALAAFTSDSAAAMAASLRTSSGSTNVNVSASAPALSRRLMSRQLMQTSPASSFAVNYIITFPAGTAKTAVLGQVSSLVARINSQGPSALGVASLGGVPVSTMTVTGLVVTAGATTGSAPPPPLPDSGSSRPIGLIVGLSVGLSLGVALLVLLALLAYRNHRARRVQPDMR